MFLSLFTVLKTLFRKNNSISEGKNSTERVKPDEKLLGRLKDRFNFASASCSARVLSCNSEASAPSALLSASKDSYLRYPCALKSKFIVVELCEAIKIDTVVLANYELFASTVKGFKVYAAGDKLTEPSVTQVIWKLILSAEMSENFTLKDQAFSVNSESFYKFLRIEFDDEFHGNERLCPISILKVYGKTMLDEFKEEFLSSGNSKDIVKDVIVPSTEKPHEEISVILDEMNRLTEKLTELQLENNFLTRKGALARECHESGQMIHNLKDKYADLELQLHILQQQSHSTGNVFKHFHDRLNKLEISLKEHPINFILFRSRRQENDNNNNNKNNFPRLTTGNPPTDFEDLFTSFKDDINSLQANFRQLNSVVHSQQTKLNLMLIFNGFLVLFILLRVLKGIFAKSSSTIRDESSLKRRPLLELKNSPSTRNSSLNSSTSSSKSLSDNRCKSTPNIALNPVQQEKRQQQFTPGVVLSDDEVLHLLEEEGQ